MRIAVFDLGSTSFHVLVVDVDGDGHMVRVLRERRTLHLAAAAAVKGHVPPEAASRALRAARFLRKHADRTQPDIVIASATSALRDAANGDHLIELLEVAVRAPIRVLEGAEEAELAYHGASAGLGIGNEPILVADLGGGSLDIAIADRHGVERTATLLLGASRMTALHIKHDPPQHAELEALAGAVHDEGKPVFDSMQRSSPMRCVVTGGTGRALARLVVAARAGGDVNGLVIPTAELHGLTQKVCAVAKRDRARIPGMQAKRVDVIPAGALILSSLAEGLDAGSITVSEWGLREGLLMEAIGVKQPRTALAS